MLRVLVAAPTSTRSTADESTDERELVCFAGLCDSPTHERCQCDRSFLLLRTRVSGITVAEIAERDMTLDDYINAFVASYVMAGLPDDGDTLSFASSEAIQTHQTLPSGRSGRYCKPAATAFTSILPKARTNRLTNSPKPAAAPSITTSPSPWRFANRSSTVATSRRPRLPSASADQHPRLGQFHGHAPPDPDPSSVCVFVLIIGQMGTFTRTRPGSEVRTPSRRA